MKKSQSILLSLTFIFFVIPPGLEPGMYEPKSHVLPLHHGTISFN